MLETGLLGWGLKFDLVSNSLFDYTQEDLARMGNQREHPIVGMLPWIPFLRIGAKIDSHQSDGQTPVRHTVTISLWRMSSIFSLPCWRKCCVFDCGPLHLFIWPDYLCARVHVGMHVIYILDELWLFWAKTLEVDRSFEMGCFDDSTYTILATRINVNTRI